MAASRYTKSKIRREYKEGSLRADTITPTPTQYARYVARILKIAKEFNDQGRYFPVWGTCLGFESMLIALSDFDLILDTDLEDNNVNHPVIFIRSVRSIFDTLMTDDEFANIRSLQLMFFNHHFGFRMNKITESKFIADNIDILSAVFTTRNEEVLAGYKHKNYPFYGVQYHPEANQFGWNPSRPFNKSEKANDIARKHALVFRTLIKNPDSVMSTSEIFEARKNVLFASQTNEDNAKFYVLPQSNNDSNVV